MCIPNISNSNASHFSLMLNDGVTQHLLASVTLEWNAIKPYEWRIIDIHANPTTHARRPNVTGL